MQLIKPFEIGDCIISMINESEKSFVIVSAFTNIYHWDKLTTAIEQAVDRNVRFDFYYREANDNRDLNYLKSIGVHLHHIPDLHVKLYFNEKHALVSSMNLIEYSNQYSIDMGIYYDAQSERDEIESFFENSIEGYVNFVNRSKSQTQIDMLHLATRFSRKFPEVTFKPRSNYLFSTNLIPGLQTLISDDTISLKHPYSKLEKERKDDWTATLNKLFHGIARVYDTSDNYARWKIEFSGTAEEFLPKLLEARRNQFPE